MGTWGERKDDTFRILSPSTTLHPLEILKILQSFRIVNSYTISATIKRIYITARKSQQPTETS